MRRFLNFLRVFLGLSVVAVFFLASSTQAKNHLYRVKKVIDGDTIELTNGKVVRYIGVDTPEMRERSLVDGWVYKPRPFAREALEFNRRLLEGKLVRLEFDVQKQDDYGRWLVYCFVDDIFINAQLLEKGFAMLYTHPPNVKYSDVFIRLFREARENQRGLWAQDQSISAENAKDFIGSIKVVRGRVGRIRDRKKTISLEFGSNKKIVFNAVIFKEDLPYFLDKDIRPSIDYAGREVRVVGLVKQYRNKPEVIIKDPSQIEVVQ